MQFARALRRLGLLAATTVLFNLPGLAQAQIGSARYAAVVMEPGSGNILFGANADAPRHPASLTKMMTLYMVFDALRAGRLSLDQRLEMTETAASRPPSKLGLPPGRTITVENAIYALVTKSANDVASLLGETLGGGSEARFAQMMTLRARAIGMTGTTFRNASGLPDVEQITTAHDMATLGRRLLHDFPERYHYFGTRTHRMGSLALRNHNRMLDEYEGVDGIKTGYINDSGFNIVSSARRGNVRLVVAVFGGSSWVERDRHAAALLERGFSQMGVGDSPARGLMASAAPGAVAATALAAGGTAAAVRRVRGPALVARAAAAPVRRAPAAAPRPAGRNLAAQAPATPARRQAAAATAPRGASARTVMEQGDGGSRVRAAAPRATTTAARTTPRHPARPEQRPQR
ncbi:D-alanyl-D-alanine carboxypeptidase family protein [Pseudoroseomonas cervicalis]|uniref:D-alanyl-D-alanine carboxypeptidase family protein n=1 Tax=Teichococcus cervicalis TaxID=204525 RepID=UPI0022F1A73E|nr:D-alanyl-D-alanine carboxypeptidase family protein [Pseudoroseomonas cervicalis]WBV44427.1 D-alanyl-D-alanine carboxypeptidase [Pseudoroseomonas cervicalis]